MTPVKEFILDDEGMTPVKLVNRKRRFNPSEKDTQILSQLLRVHSFLKHEEVEFLDLRSFEISKKTADELSRHLQCHIDIPDVIIRMEEIAVKRNYFTLFLKQYVVEEYCVQEEYSFTVIALLHYMNRKGATGAEAITELLEYSTLKAICITCCSVGSTKEEKEKIVEIHNYELLKKFVGERRTSNEDLIYDDLNPSDDSLNDREYEYEGDLDISSDESVKESDDDSESKDFFNPFDNSEKDDENSEVDGFEPGLNSTLSFNPFDESDESAPSKSPQNVNIECEHCKKQFSNRYNMKLHLIRRVILQLQYFFIVLCHECHQIK